MSKTAIIVDDSKLSRMQLRKMILQRQPDWTVLEAANGSEAFDLIQQSEVHVALIDYNMPGENGLELAVRLRALGTDLRLAIISANAQDSIVSGARALRAAFMPKPLDEDQVGRFLAAATLPAPRRP